MDDAMAVALEAKAEAQRALAGVSAHEVLCTERWRATREDMKRVNDTISTFSKIGIGVMVALIGWGGAQLYSHLDAKAPPVAVGRLK